MGETLVKEEFSEEDYQEAVGWRRLLHRHAQPGWMEFYATGFVAEKLTEWGYQLRMGRDIVEEDKLLLLPDSNKLEEEYQRALHSGIKEEYLLSAKGGFTGVVAILKGSKPGPMVGFRFDIDSNEVTESQDDDHFPAKEGFMSETEGYAHMCGHDAHTATGLLLAKWFADHQDELAGSVKLIFQPNEESLSGAAAMVDTGIVDDVDYLLGGHVGTAAKHVGDIAVDVRGMMAMSRFEVIFHGRSAHAAGAPHEGKNALLGACTAITNLLAIARHTEGATTVNVGYLRSGSDWNVVPEKAYFWLETRGDSSEINEYMVRRSKEIIAGAAKMYDLRYEIRPAAVCFGGENSPQLVTLAEQVANKLPSVTRILPKPAIGGSEDFTVFMQRVQEHGGQALFALFGTPTCGGHHNAKFSINEKVIKNAAEFYIAMYYAITKAKEGV